jgi:eukaryotic-like serine/threonine-protein kinase
LTLTALRTEEPIAGYRVIQRLGAGGYGEVWKAEAPGGLQKAIKFVYGYLNDEKAARELKALNRIKQLRHPFLLSLERIEVIEGQLLIVTELADHSLKDRFLVCQKAAQGIQRDELLGYMRDAADALDYLCDNALQHLDVKPENLLIVGGRVKVADFGLVKEIQDRTYSMMGGMTPVYAAPEIFDGRPTSHSDQYSLAIVYQEMLTGNLPFPGNTAAQLASQHLNSKPRLESLPPEDAAVIARALAKNPLDRFTNTREMVAALHGGGRKPSVSVPGGAADSISSPNLDTESVGDHQSRVSTLTPSPPSAPAERRTPRRSPAVEPSSQPRHVECRTQAITRPEPKPIIDLPPIEISKDEIGLRPTLFVGVGGTGGSVLRRLRRRLNDRFGELAKVPVFQMLLVETDSHALRSQSGAEQGSDLSADETVMMPLRKPQEYRSETPDILEWLSRRWLYNIPRSLKTEGIRPLGRLALVDHANALFDRARTSLTQIASAAALAAAQSNTGLPLRNKTPRIFVVASTSGGTGSGMALDVAYALRMLLLDMGLSDDGVCGILTHSTPRKSTGKDLATANTYALLNELFHYSRNHFPGEPACGLRAFGFGDPTFPQAYFVHFGDHLDDHDFNHAADALAGYLYLDVATAAGTFFDKCRAATRNALDPNELRLRTLGLCQLGRSQADFIAPAVESICKQVAEQWASGSRSAQPAAPKAADDSAEQTYQSKLTELEMTGAQLAKHFQSLADQFVPPKKLTELTSEILHEQGDGDASASRAALWSQLTQRVRQSLGIVPSHDLPPSAVSLASFAADHVKRRTDQVASQLTHLIHTAADDPNLGLTGAFKSGEKWIEHLRRAEGELSAIVTAAQQRAAQLGAIIEQPPPAARGKQRPEQPITIAQALNEYCGLLVHQKAFETAIRLIQSITGRLAAVNDKLIQLRRDVIHVSNRFESSDPAVNGDDHEHDHSHPINAVEAALKRQLQTRMTHILKQVAQQAREQCVSPAGGLVQLMSGAAQQVDHLPGVLRSIARKAIAASLQEVDIGSLILTAPTDESEDSPIDNVLDSARPRMINCGGGKRLLLIVPDGPSAAKVSEVIEQKHHEKPTVITGGEGDLVACYECEDIPLSSVIARLITDNPSYAEVGHRLHTRIDVEWIAL